MLSYRDRKRRIGPVLLWWGGRNWSLHIGKRRVVWVRDFRRWPEVFSEREWLVSYLQLGVYRVRVWEHI